MKNPLWVLFIDILIFPTPPKSASEKVAGQGPGYTLCIVQSLLLLLAFAAHACAATTPSPFAGPKTVGVELDDAFPPQVFVTKSGVILSLAKLKPVGQVPGQMLARFTGIEHPLEGKTVRLIKEVYQHRTVWKLPFDGMPFPLVVQVVSRSSQPSITTELWLPRTRIRVPVPFDKEASLALAAGTLLTSYQQITNLENIKKLASLDRSTHIARTEATLSRLSKKLNSECGVDIPVAVLWHRISDSELAQEIPLSTPVRAVETLCRKNATSRDSVRQHIKRVVVSMEETNALKLQDGELHIALHLRTRPGAQVSEDALRRLLGLGDIVLKNAKGQYLVARQGDGRDRYLGDAQTLYRLHPSSHLVNQSKHVWGVRGDLELRKSPTGLTAKCVSGDVEFRAVPAEERLQVVRTATFAEPLWKRTPFAIARDDRGVYYYVDHFDAANGGKGYRVFKGQRGQMQQAPLVDIVNDSDGMILATSSGKLRLVLGPPQASKASKKNKATWIAGRKKRPLTMLPLAENRELIYLHLGVYDNDNLGTICP